MNTYLGVALFLKVFSLEHPKRHCKHYSKTKCVWFRLHVGVFGVAGLPAIPEIPTYTFDLDVV